MLTSGIIAFLDRDDHYHSLVVDIIKNYQIYIPVTILPEVDYLATKYLGERVGRRVLEDLADESLSIINLQTEELERIGKRDRLWR